MKFCPLCRETKPESDFYRGSVASGSKIRGYCKPCTNQDNYRRTKERLADPEYAALYREGIRRRNRAYNRRLRLGILDGYGGRCACCGETTPEFLAIDHINNDGAAHRASLSMGRKSPDPMGFYRWLRDNGYPRDRFQLLCHNCNSAKAWYGACPHSLVA